MFTWLQNKNKDRLLSVLIARGELLLFLWLRGYGGKEVVLLYSPNDGHPSYLHIYIIYIGLY